MAGKKRLEKEKCKYTVGDYKCSRDALPGDEHCIFHSEDIEGKKEKKRRGQVFYLPHPQHTR